MCRMATRLGELFRMYRAVHGLSVRAHAEEMGVTKSTLHRIESSNPGGMTLDTFMKVQHWLLNGRSTQENHTT